MTDETTLLLIVVVTSAIGLAAAATLIAMERSRQRRALAFENGYRDGWRVCRDGNPPKDFP